MKSMIAITVFVALASQTAPKEPVLGLLSLADVFGPRMCVPFEPQQVALHAAPNDGRPFAFISVDRNWSFAPHGGCEGLEVSVHQGDERHQLPTLEYDYEMPAAIVLEQRDGWFRIRLTDRPAWIKASPADRFMPIAELYKRNLSA